MATWTPPANRFRQRGRGRGAGVSYGRQYSSPAASSPRAPQPKTPLPKDIINHLRYPGNIDMNDNLLTVS